MDLRMSSPIAELSDPPPGYTLESLVGKTALLTPVGEAVKANPYKAVLEAKQAATGEALPVSVLSGAAGGLDATILDLLRRFPC